VRVAIAILAATLGLYAPILYYMTRHWSEVQDYSHGFIVAPLAIYFAYERRAALQRASVSTSWWGVVPLLLGCLTLTIGRLGMELMNLRVSFVLTVAGLVLLLLGREIFRILAFPIGFLLLMIPLPQSLVNVVAFPLQLQAADWAVRIISALGVPALREGNVIHLPDTALFVAEACSGLRSLMALITLGVVFAYFYRKSWIERAVIVLSAIPIAIVVNALRVALTGVLAYHYGRDAGAGALHEFQGLITFAAAWVLLLLEAWLLARWWPVRWRARPRATGRTGS
jgi:exosortase